MDYMESIIGNIIGWKSKKKISPLHLLIIPTNGCNLSCISCNARGKQRYLPGKEISEKEYLRLINEAAELGIKSCEISGGGEPLFSYKKTVIIMRQIKKKNMAGKLFTNGILFQKKLLRELVEIGWDSFHFSMDGPDAETHDYLRQSKGAFEKLIFNIKFINKLKKELGVKKPKIAIASLLISQNYNKIDKMLFLCKGLGIDYTYFQTLQIRDKNKGGKIMLKEQDQISFLENLKVAKKIAFKENINTNLDKLEPVFIKKSCKIKELIKIHSTINPQYWFEAIPCFKPWTSMVINLFGRVGICPALTDNSAQLSLKALWQGKYIEDLRNSFVSNKIPEKCSLCCGNVVLDNKEIKSKLIRISR